MYAVLIDHRKENYIQSMTYPFNKSHLASDTTITLGLVYYKMYFKYFEKAFGKQTNVY